MPSRSLTILLSLLLTPLTSLAGKFRAVPPLSGKPRTISLPVLASDSSSCIIPFNRVGNLVVLQAKVDSMEGNFVLDTGAPGLVLNLTYFRDYPITAKHDEDQTSINGRGGTTQQTAVSELSFGTMRFYRTTADLTNLGNIENAKGIKVLGLLGLELFSQCEMIIDFETGQIHLHRIGRKERDTYGHACLTDTSAYRSFAIDIADNRMTTTTEVAGKKLKLVIDCAAEANILDSRLPEKIFDLITITGRVKLTAPGDKKADALYGNLSRMKMGTQQIENLPVVIVNLQYTCFSDDICINGVLGFDFLSQHRVGFNFVKRKMYIWK